MIENDIKQQLITAGIDVDANIVFGTMPTTPDNAIVIATSDSILTNRENTLTNIAAIPAGISDIQQTITITVRNTNYASGQGKSWDVYNELVGQENGFKVCNNRQMFIMAAQPPHYLKDENGKSHFTFNFVANTSRDN